MAKPSVCPVPPPDITVYGAQFVYQPNFEGREGRYNKLGDRNFNMRIPDDIVEQVLADSWNLKWTKPKTDERQPEPYIEVSVGFKYRPPEIVIIRDGAETLVDENTVGLIDSMQFEKMDIVLRGRAWENEDGCGIKAWLKTFYGTVEMDDVRRKYAHLRAE